MPSSIIQGVLELVLQVILEVEAYFIGSIVVPVVSLGRWNCENLSDPAPRKKFWAMGFYRLRNGQIYLTVEATQLVGVLTILLAIGGGVLIWYSRR
jgi:hypothetical protein